MPSVIVVRKTMLAECFGAEVLRTYHGVEVIGTDPLVAPTPELLQQVSGKDVLIVGGYYTKSLSEFVAVAKSVTVFYNTSDVPSETPHTIVRAESNRGFATYAVKKASVNDGLLGDIAEWLDEYLYGFPSQQSLQFQNGIYTLDAPTDIEKLKLVIDGKHDIVDVLERGAKKRAEHNLVIAGERFAAAKEYTVLGKKVLVAVGGSPIVDTCLMLCKPTGIGMLVRYDEEKQRTLVSCRVTEESGENAGTIMQQFIGGGGSRPMGGGSVPDILTLDELFAKYPTQQA